MKGLEADVVEIGYGMSVDMLKASRAELDKSFQKMNSRCRGSSVASQHHFFTPSCFRWIGCGSSSARRSRRTLPQFRNAKVRTCDVLPQA